MKKFNRKFKEKFTEYYAFRHFIYTTIFIIVAIIFIALADLYMIFGYLLVLISILWFIFVALPNNKICLIRSKILKELEIEKLVNEEYIKEFIKEKK